MKKENLPSLFKGVGNILKKILICFMIIVMIIVSLGIFILRDFGLGYKYYEIQESQTIYVGVSQEENLIERTINEHLKYLEDNGYYIASSELNIKLLCEQIVIKKSDTNDNEIKKRIIDSLDVQVLCIKLNIKEDETVYYFKTENDSICFINELNKYIQQEYSTEGIIIDYKLITSNKVLETKKNNVIEQRKKIDEERRIAEQKKAEKKKYQVTSRGGTSRSNSNYKGGAPMASYTYISSYYGQRSRGWHTGVDFAAPAGTHIYAWKSGTVTFAGWSGSYGKFIVVDHGDGTISRYAHCSGYAVSEGDPVSKGQTIGYVGTTGNSTGNHLHFEIKINGEFVNPLNYL